MKRLAWYAGVAAGLASLIVVPVAAAKRGEGPHAGRGHGARLAEALDLTDDQRAQMRTITEKYRGGDAGERLDDLREARGQLRRLIHDASASDAQVRDAAKEMSAAEALVSVDRHRMAVEIDGLLTDEQRAKAAELRQRRQERRHGGPQREIDEP